MNKSILFRLGQHVGKYKRYMLAAFICAILSVAASLAGPFLIGQAIDKMIGNKAVDFILLRKVLIVLAINYAGGSLFSWLLIYLTNQVAYNAVNDLRNNLFEKLSKLPLEFYDTNAHGDIISRFANDLDAIGDGLLQVLSAFLTGFVTIIGAICVMMYKDPIMTIVVFLFTPLSYLVARFITNRSQKMFKRQAQSLGSLNGYVEEVIGGQKIVKAFNYENRSKEKFREINGELYKSGVKAQFYSSLTNPSTRLINNITYSVIGVVGSIRGILGKITIGGISSFLIYANLFAKPFNEITSVIAQIQAAVASAERVFAIYDLEEEKPDKKGQVANKPVQGEIVFDKVSFSYNPERPLIKNFSLQVPRGSKIAIVGPTGAGKTTLVNLLMRFYELDSGSIFLDGINISNMTRDELRRNFGMVLQDTWLFAGTVRDNIAYGKPEATDEEIIAAAKAADAHSFIKRLPEGYHTLINATGDNLSQGQKQLLTIARVMLLDPPILILDEATSSIDTRTEIRIQKAFLKMIKGRTSFVIAHRLSTVKEADLILVLDNGNIVERGTHEQLLKINGSYAKLYYSQFLPA